MKSDLKYTIQLGGMHTVSGNNPWNSDQVSSEPLHINSCGYNCLDNNEERIPTIRPEGRTDWQLIYIQEGKGDFTIDGVSYVLEKGAMILYAPNEAQDYCYYSSYRTIAFWVHFTGTSVEALMSRNRLLGKNIFQVGEVSFFF